MAEILIVDSDGEYAASLEAQLLAEGHRCAQARDASSAISLLGQRSFDLVLSEWRLLDMTGPAFARSLRAEPGTFLTRLVFIAPAADPHAVATALEDGADDFLDKAVRPPELQARIHAVLRRPPASTPDSHVVGPICLEKGSHRVSVNGQALQLAPVEYRLLAYFIENPGRVLPRQQLLEQVWRRRQGIGLRTVDVHVRRLRAALEPHACADLLQTVRGYGYRFG